MVPVTARNPTAATTATRTRSATAAAVRRVPCRLVPRDGNAGSFRDTGGGISGSDSLGTSDGSEPDGCDDGNSNSFSYSDNGTSGSVSFGNGDGNSTSFSNTGSGISGSDSFGTSDGSESDGCDDGNGSWNDSLECGRGWVGVTVHGMAGGPLKPRRGPMRSRRIRRPRDPGKVRSPRGAAVLSTWSSVTPPERRTCLS